MLASLTLVLGLSPGPAQEADWRAQREAARALELPAVGDDDLTAWRERIRPRGDELAFERVPWIASLAEGVRASEREQKPLLFWAMNGHPLGCT